jgi:hypothetical protein
VQASETFAKAIGVIVPMTAVKCARLKSPNSAGMEPAAVKPAAMKPAKSAPVKPAAVKPAKSAPMKPSAASMRRIGEIGLEEKSCA